MGYNKTCPTSQIFNDNFLQTLNIGMLYNRRTLIKPQNTHTGFGRVIHQYFTTRKLILRSRYVFKIKLPFHCIYHTNLHTQFIPAA